MDYQEAIKEAETQIYMYERMILYNKDFEPKNDNSNYENKIDFLKTAIYAMQELQEYKKLGTLEEMKFLKETHLTGVELVQISCRLEQLMEYKKIGTLEEVREAVEKQRAAHPLEMLGIFDEKEYECINCGNTVPHMDKYCKWCGKKQDWRYV